MRPLLLALLLTGCAHLSSVSVTPIPAAVGVPVASEVESQLMFLGITGHNDYVDDVVRDLRDQCENSQIQSILTKHETLSYFLFTKVCIHASGRCIQ